MSQEKKEYELSIGCSLNPLQAFNELSNLLQNTNMPAVEAVRLLALLTKVGEIFGGQVQTNSIDDPTDGDGVPHQPGNPKP